MAMVIKAAYDPLSTTQTLRCVGLLSRFLADFPTLTGESKQVRELLKEVRDKVKASVESDPYIPIGYSKQIMESPNGPHAQFTNRQFWSCFKLFRNVLSWQEILGDRILADLAVGSLLNRYIVIALGMNPDPLDVIAKSKQIVATLPASWREEGSVFKDDLSRFATFLFQLGSKVKQGRDPIAEVVNMLKFIGYTQESDTLRRTRL